MLRNVLFTILTVFIMFSKIHAANSLESQIEKFLKSELNCEKVDVTILKTDRNYNSSEVSNFHLVGRTFEKAPIIIELTDGSSKIILCKIKAYSKVFFTKKTINKGQKIDYADVYHALVPIQSVPDGVIKDVENIVNKVVNRTIGTGIAVTSNMFDAHDLVKKGQKINIIIENKSIRISAKGELQNSATVGSYVKVLNYASKKVIMGKLVDHNTVILDN